MRTIKDLKEHVNVFGESFKVIVQTIDIHKDFYKGYENWEEFEDDHSIDDLVLHKRYFLDIHDSCIEIWTE